MALANGRPDLRFFHERCANLFAQLDELDIANRREARSGWDEVTHDYVLFESAEPIDFAERCRLGQNPGRILE